MQRLTVGASRSGSRSRWWGGRRLRARRHLYRL